MKEYIERTALIRYAEKQEVIIKDGTSIADAMRIQGNVFRRCVETCPAVDAVEVVRCRECKHYKQIPWGEDVMCQLWVDWLPTDPDDFCSQGERRENEQA